MGGSNTSLTVSYGAFSCTLEGFDDPINTMQAVAEYFRDLTAEDPRFGAEPAQPDPKVLQRLGGAGLARDVEVQTGPDGLRLRQTPVDASRHARSAAKDGPRADAAGPQISGRAERDPQAARPVAPLHAATPDARHAAVAVQPLDIPAPESAEPAIAPARPVPEAAQPQGRRPAETGPALAANAAGERDGTAEPEGADVVALHAGASGATRGAPAEAACDATRADRHGPSGGDQDEAALSRLLDETNAKLDSADANRRRSAIAHLKAAVAATRADGGLRDRRKKDEAAALGRYREDLARAVRPPRVAQDDAAAPLILVSDLRIDLPPAASGPDGAPDRAPPSFDEFVRRMGAVELPDLLEAAAAYAKIVEGRDAVSRPQLMRRATSLSRAGRHSREDILRSFGQLLHSGRLRKTAQGLFEIGETAPIAERAGAARS